MEKISAFFVDGYAWVCGQWAAWYAELSALWVALILLGLLLLVLLLLILLIARAGKLRKARASIAQLKGQIIAAERDAKTFVDQQLREQQLRQNELYEQISRREQLTLDGIAQKERALADKTDELLQLRQFHEEFKTVQDARAAANAIVAEAKSYADDIKLRANADYMEIVNLAQSESTAVRDMAQRMLVRAGQLLSNSLDRSKQILDDAHRDLWAPGEYLPRTMERAIGELAQVEVPADPDTEEQA